MPLTPPDPDEPGAFLGKGLGWPPREDPVTGDFVRVEDEQSVFESLSNLIHIALGTVPGAEDVGTDVEGLLFSSLDPSELDLIGEGIRRAIRTYEKRVFFLNATFVPRAQPGGRISAHARITYRVRATGEVVTNVFPFTIKKEG